MSQDRPGGFAASDPPDITTWPTKAQVAAILGKSIKTIERYAISRERSMRLRKSDRHVPGRKPEPVFHPDDVQRLKKALDAVEVRTAEQGREYALSVASAARPAAAPPGGLAVAAILERLALVAERLSAPAIAAPPPPPPPAVRITEKMLLTIGEACELGWSSGDLRQLVRQGALRNFGGPGKYRVARADLERLLTVQMQCVGCGCTETTACQTAAGPCHWVAPGLCSACAEKLEPRVALASQLVTGGVR